MNKKMKELLGRIATKQKEAQALLDEKDFDSAEKALDECDTLRREYDLVERAYKDQKAEAFEAMEAAGVGAASDKEASAAAASVEKFGHDVKDRIKAFTGLSEGISGSSQLVVPEDVSTRLEQLRTARASLLDLVRVTPTKTKSGSRFFKKRTTNRGFTLVTEGGAITEGEPPKFGKYDYAIKKYAGFYPVTSELLEDSDDNVSNILAEWLAEESQATVNRLIMDTVKTKTAKAVTSIDDVKYAFNVTLGQAFAATSKVITNDDGLNWLDCLKDKNGNPLLRENPTDPLSPILALGFRRVPLMVVPNVVMETTDKKIPFIVGDLREAVEFFDRKHRTIMASNSATAGDYNAFSNDLVILRGIEREDVVTRDADAFVRLELDTTVSNTE